MPLPAGTQLGTHKLLALISVRDMGEVYKAQTGSPSVWNRCEIAICRKQSGHL